MTRLAEELLGHDERYELHRLLGALLSKKLIVRNMVSENRNYWRHCLREAILLSKQLGRPLTQEELKGFEV